MIDVTVKTLDSQNHRYSVPGDISVKQFKDRIANSVNIPPDKQRLIYCGRVLQDDKNLSDYNVHEKVIHLVMRAPPQQPSRSNERRSNGPSSNSSPGLHIHHRATNQSPSSSGVRLQQAKSMLDKAAEILNRLESSSSRNSPQEPSGDASMNTEATTAERMETCERASATEELSTNSSELQATEEGEERSSHNETQSTPSSSSELDSLYQEMDALNNMDPPMVEGGHLMTSAIGNPLMGAISNSLQGGLFQAASAAFVSALSSLGGGPTTTTSSSSSSSSTTSASASATTQTPSSTTSTISSSARGTSTSTSSSQNPSSSGSSNRTSSSSNLREGPNSTGNPPLSGVRGITVRITNRGPQRSSGIRLEHPRCSVMVEVLDQYEEVQRRLQPFLRSYHNCMVEDRSYEENDRQVYADQLLVWRVSAAMHYMSHALHAISDIMIDLRRPPPRQLRARPFIIPQPALVQAQINVAPSSEGNGGNTRLIARNSSSSTTTTATTTTTTNNTSRENLSSASTGGSSGTGSSLTLGPSSLSRSFVNMSDMMEDDNGVVFMHVGPNGITIDSLSAEGTGGNDSGSSPPPELIQNLVSSLSTQLGMRLGGSQATSTSSTSSASPPSTPGVRRVPVHNSQAAGNSGTSTTNATQTRVTPRAQQLHVTPLHVPGMGMTQFDPFLPCQSHHIRPTTAASRRRHRATVQTSSTGAASSTDNAREEVNSRDERRESDEANRNDSAQTTSNEPGSNSTRNSTSSTTPTSSHHLLMFTNLLTEIMSATNNDNQSEEEQQQERMFAQLVRGVISEMPASIMTSQSSDGSQRQQRQQTSLQEFLEPFSVGGFFPEGGRETIFAHLFNTISQSLSMGDLIDLVFGDSTRINQLFEPLQELVRDKVLRGMEPTEANLDLAIDEILNDIEPHLIAFAENAAVHDSIDYVNTVNNFLRHRLHDIFNLILNHRDEGTFGSVLVSLLWRIISEFVALSLYCFTDRAQGLERLVQGRIQYLMSRVSPSIQAWSVNTAIMQLRSMMSHLAITEDHIRRYIISPDEGQRMDEARRQNRKIASSAVNPHLTQEPQPSSDKDESIQQNAVNGLVEVMDVDDSAEEGIETVSQSLPTEQQPPPLEVTIGSQPWHSAVPQDWIPVITRDVDRQRRGVPDTNLSDGYLCGVPLKRRKIATQSKPHGSVQQVLQDTLRQSLRSTGVNRTLIESVSNEVSSDLGDCFGAHVRCALREELESNEDFVPEKFPKSDQKIRRKR